MALATRGSIFGVGGGYAHPAGYMFDLTATEAKARPIADEVADDVDGWVGGNAQINIKHAGQTMLDRFGLRPLILQDQKLRTFLNEPKTIPARINKDILDLAAAAGTEYKSLHNTLTEQMGAVAATQAADEIMGRYISDRLKVIEIKYPKGFVDFASAQVSKINEPEGLKIAKAMAAV